MLNTKSLIKKNPIKNLISEEENILKLEENIDINQKIINEQNATYNEISIEKNEKIENKPFHGGIIKLPINKPYRNILVNNKIIEKNKDNFIEDNFIEDKFTEDNIIEDNVTWDDRSSCYLLYDSNNELRTITNEDIVNYILNNKNNEIVKRYIFTINYNSISEQCEYNLLVTKFTENIDIMIKLINFIGESINNYENIGNSSEEQVDKLMIFYYQIIIFMFKNILQTKNHDLVKLSKYSSYLCYKYSTMILKKIMKIDENNSNIQNSLEHLLVIKNNLSIQLTNISNLLNQEDQDKLNLENKTPKKYLHNSSFKRINNNDSENTSSENSYESSNNSQKKYKISKSDNDYSINKLMYLLTENNINNSDDNINDNSDDNNYQEIEYLTENNKDNKSNYSKTTNSELLISDTNNDTISENLYKIEEIISNNLKKTSNTKSKTDMSYNLNSALKNSKLIEMKL